jgi:hypothetical protein
MFHFEDANMFDLNDQGVPEEWLDLLRLAEENAETEFEHEFCQSLREKFETYGERAQLTDAQLDKLRCIAHAGGFWERGP